MDCKIFFKSLINVLVLTKCYFVLLAPNELVHTSVCLIFLCLASALASKRIAHAFWRYGSFILAVISVVASILLCLRESQIRLLNY